MKCPLVSCYTMAPSDLSLSRSIASNILAYIHTFYSLIDLTLSLSAYNFNNVINIAPNFYLRLKLAFNL